MAVLIGAGGHFLAARWWRFHILLRFLGLQQDRDEGLGLIIRHDGRRDGVHLEATLLLLLLGVEAQGTRSLQFQRWRRRCTVAVIVAEKSTCPSSRDRWRKQVICNRWYAITFVFLSLSLSCQSWVRVDLSHTLGEDLIHWKLDSRNAKLTRRGIYKNMEKSVQIFY